MKGTRLVAFVLCLLIAGGAAGYIVYTMVSSQQSKKAYEQMRENVITSESSTTEVTTTQPETTVTEEVTTESTVETTVETTEETKALFQSPVDFVQLQRTNPDIYAWIDIVGTDMSFPILQHNLDPDYYLMHRADGSYGWPGAIYTHTIMPKDFSCFNVIIYGHNMVDGTMFAALEEYRDEQFLQEHREIIIYTPHKTMHYTVFAAILYNNLVINSQFDFEQESERVRFLESLDSVKNLNNHICDDIEVGPDDSIITLETCASGDHDHRYLILAVLTDVEE